MPVRWELSNQGAAPVSPAFDAAWEQNGQADRALWLPKSLSRTVSPLADKTVTVPITTTQQILSRQFVGPPMPPIRIEGTFSLVIRCSESATSANAHIAFILRVVSQDGGTVRGTLASQLATATEFTTAAQTRIINAAALTALTTLPGDRLVLEIGVHAQAPTAAQSAVHRFGNSAASDFALTSGLTTDLNPWAELSSDLWGTRFNNHHFVRADSGISVGEKVR